MTTHQHQAVWLERHAAAVPLAHLERAGAHADGEVGLEGATVGGAMCDDRLEAPRHKLRGGPRRREGPGRERECGLMKTEKEIWMR